MIRFLQTPGPTKKIILGGMLLVICAAMVITLVPGGISYSISVMVAPGGHPAETGRQIVELIRHFEKARGASWRSA